jgi:amino acid transporter
VFTSNPFTPVTDFLPPLALQGYVILMILVVAGGTLFDIVHKRSGRFFALRREKSRAAATKQLTAFETAAIAARTLATEVATAGEFCNRNRRISHVLMFYGFLFYLITTIVMIFAYPTDPHTPVVLPALWSIGILMVLVGGYWFFFYLRVNVTHDGRSPWRLERADLFIVTLLASVTFALIFGLVQSAGNRTATMLCFGIYIFFTTLLFVSVPWSKFAHMFYKPAAAFQRRVEEANGSSDLPRPAGEHNHTR